MKKVILLLAISLFGSCSAIAECNYQCVTPYDMNGKFRSVLSTITGANFISEQVAKKSIKNEIEKYIKGKDLKFDIDSYSSKDLKNGIFKSMSVKGKNVTVNDIAHLSTLEMKTLCDFNYIKNTKDGAQFVEDFPVSIAISMNENDINETLKSNKYQKVIDDINRIGFAGFKISSTKVELKSNKFHYIIGFAIPFVKSEKTITIIADLKVKDGKIDFDNTKLASKTINFDLSKINFILDYLNPLDFSINILNDKGAKVNINNIEIKDNIIYADGIAVIPKD